LRLLFIGVRDLREQSICGSSHECIDKENVVVSKTQKIIIALGVVTIGVFVVIVVIGVVAYVLYSRPARDGEMVFAATEVGTPAGNKVTKDIGPEGGTLVSPDSRLMLTVPPNALTETLPFSIQPITNKAGGGLGRAYRLGPDGKTFTTPLQLSVRYDDHDLEGTVPEALAIAYQDAKGAWHGQTSARLDQVAKTLTISTTHFTDEAFLARVRIEPIEATIRVGETHVVTLYHCKEPGEEPFSISRLFRQPRNCSPVSPGANAWSLRGAGTLEPWSKDGVLYKAPARKPTPNIVFVVVNYKFEMWNPTTGEIVLGQKAFGAQITIVDRGYRASGNAGGDTVFSGDICDLGKHFTLKTNNPFLSSFDFYTDKNSKTKGKL